MPGAECKARREGTLEFRPALRSPCRTSHLAPDSQPPKPAESTSLRASWNLALIWQHTVSPIGSGPPPRVGRQAALTTRHREPAICN